MAVAVIAACASPGPPEPYWFPSNLSPADAMGCVSSTLRLEGFAVTPHADRVPVAAPDTTLAVAPDSASPSTPNGGSPAPAADSLVALRSVTTEEVGAREWWRLDLSVSLDVEGGTVVHSVAGVADREEGPWQAPSMGLQSLWGKLTATCTWGSGRQPGG
jgi:hypothetical protein